jgi:pimeloyl-ACP methyl ester carboxylesterase
VNHTFRYERDGLTLVVHRHRATTADAPARVFLLVHGIGVSSKYYRRLIPELVPHGTVFAVDLPGFGDAPKPEPRRRLGVEDYALLLVDFLADAGISHAVLVGQSMGTQMVTEMAARHPGLASHVVLIGPVVDPTAPTALGQSLRLAHDICIEPPSANLVVMTEYIRCGPRWYLTELPSMLDYPMLERLASVHAPTLVMRGAHDPIAPAAWTQRVTEALPHATRFDVPQAAHLAQFRSPRVVAGAILEHLRAAPSRPAEPGTLPR